MIPAKYENRYPLLTNDQRKCAQMMIDGHYGAMSRKLARNADVKYDTLCSWWYRNVRGYRDYVLEIARLKFDARSPEVLEAINNYALSPKGNSDRRLVAEVEGWIKRDNVVNVGVVINLQTSVPVRDTAKVAEQAEVVNQDKVN